MSAREAGTRRRSNGSPTARGPVQGLLLYVFAVLLRSPVMCPKRVPIQTCS